MDEMDRYMLKVAKAYEDEDFDLYESLLEKGAKKYDCTVGMFEDWCTDVRLFGVDSCG